MTLSDFPGKVACIVFLVNCNFKCRYCYNAELTSFSRFKKGKRHLVPEKEIFDFLSAQRKMLDGVVITGGEPTMSPGLIPFMKKIKSLGFAIKLDTNGTRPETLRKILHAELADYVAMDLKAPLGNYREITQSRVDPHNILESAMLLIDSKVPHEFRTTLYPRLTKEDMVGIASIIPGQRLLLQHFQSKKVLDPKSRRLKPMTNAKVKEIVSAIGKTVSVELRE